jgi:hypothetical protein
MFRLPLWLVPLFYISVVAGLACPAPLRLKQLLQAEMDGSRDSDKPILMPCCYDGLTARLITRAGFDATFMTGFGVSGALLVSWSVTKLYFFSLILRLKCFLLFG